MTKTHEGTISISRTSGGPYEATPVLIEIRDNSSGTRFIEARMSLEAFASAIMGRGDAPVTFTLTGTEYVGARHENKSEIVVAQSNPGYDRKSRIRASRDAVQPFLTDGWYPRDSDVYNPHNRVNAGDAAKAGLSLLPDETAYRVVFFRKVRPDGTVVPPTREED